MRERVAMRVQCAAGRVSVCVCVCADCIIIQSVDICIRHIRSSHARMHAYIAGAMLCTPDCWYIDTIDNVDGGEMLSACGEDDE